MSWPDPPRGRTDPAYYHDAADSTEAQIRADFTQYHQLREIAPFAETPAQEREFHHRAAELAATWGRHEFAPRRMLWNQLHAAVAGWQLRPERTRQLYDQLSRSEAAHEPSVDPLAWRNIRQAGEITGHVENTTFQSSQDGARWRPHDRTRDQERDQQPLRAFERALGGRIPDEPAVETTTPLPTVAEEQQVATRAVQDLTAQHTILAQTWNGSTEHDQALLARLESLLEAAQSARADAAAAGVGTKELDAAYRTGRDGIFWAQQPGIPTPARQGDMGTARQHGATATALSRTPGSDSTTDPPTDIGHSAVEVVNTDPAGALITEATLAALPATHLHAWQDPEPEPSVEVPSNFGIEVDL